MALTDASVRTAKQQEKPYKLYDTLGFFVLAKRNGSKLWWQKCRQRGEERLLAQGAYPQVPLADARPKRDEVRDQMAEGIEPSAQRGMDQIEAETKVRTTFPMAAEEYLEMARDRELSVQTGMKKAWQIHQLAGPLHQRPIAKITAAGVLHLLKKIEKSGRRKAATKPRGALSAVFRLAVARLRAGNDRTCAIKPVAAARRSRPAQLLGALAIATAVAGCGLQAKIIEERHWDLNETIRATKNEQLLLNLVRLRYDETPYFLQVAGVTTSFSAGANIGATGSFPQNAGNVLGASAGLSYSETPTVTWSVPDSREFLGRLFAPMGADQLTVLTQAGLDPAFVLRIGVRKMNRLRNIEFNVRSGVVEPSSYNGFVEALDLLEPLLREDLVDFAYGVYSNVGGGKFPMSKLDIRAMPEGLDRGMQFMTRDNPNVFEALKLSKPLFLRFSKRSDADPRAQRLRSLLNLDPTAYSFAIIDAGNSGSDQLRTESGKIAQIYDPNRRFKEIVVSNRSVIETLRLAATYVEAPKADVERGIVREFPRTADWLRIRSSATEPGDAWLKVQRNGMWFYIAADDINSRISFTLLNALFASVVGEVPGARPLLTLPVK